MIKYYTDIHCHPVLKPFGRSIHRTNTNYYTDKSSIWYYDPPALKDRIVEMLFGLASYSQSDFTASALGNVLVKGVSLHPPEVSFFKNRISNHELSDYIENWVTGYGERRIKMIESDQYRYFDDLLEQYYYIRQMDGIIVNYKGQSFRYLIAHSFRDITEALNDKGCTTIAIVLNIEGGHSLNCGINYPVNKANEKDVLRNIDIIKYWEHRPLYITLAHHFYNELCGHTKSIPPMIDMIIDQSAGMETGITELGMKVIRQLLNNQNQNRILIDVKHMSIEARKQYYHMLDTEFSSEKIPIVFSHGGVTGIRSFSEAGNIKQNTLFNEWNINLFDEEIIRITKSNGLIGLNLDQRIMASRQEIKKAGSYLMRHKILYHWSRLIWNNIQHIAEILDNEGLDAWSTVCIGSDFDGMINPVNGFRTDEDIPLFEKYLTMHAREYMKHNKTSSLNKLDPEEIIQKIMSDNAMEFMKQNYKVQLSVLNEPFIMS